jgi:serine/threonine-protein kinase
MDLLTTLQGPLAGRYRLERELGRGGMATVYLADDLKHGRRVAIKVLRHELAASLGGERFLREISLAAGLQHPHILPLYDSGAHGTGSDEILFYVMPYVEGESLRDLLVREGQLPVDAALTIAREVLDALAAAHAHGIVHRDVKPENILLSGGHALVADFGIARAVGVAGGERLTETGLAIGTAAYMSPEQAAAEREVDARSDLYSLGCVLYEMLVGEPPFTGPNAQAIMVKRLTDAAPSARRLRDTVSPEVDTALCRALSRAPADRFPSAAAFAAALHPVATPTSTPAPQGIPRRSRLSLLAALVLLVAVVAGIVWARRRPAVDAVQRLALTDLVVGNRDPSTDYLRSGIPDYLVSALRRLPGLEVMPMSLVRRDSALTSPVDLGKRLNASAVLTGTLARFGGTLAINAELVQVADGRLLWSGQFEYPDTNYAGLIPTVVGVIADSLRLQLSGGSRAEAVERSIVDPVVLDLLLRGRDLYSRSTLGAPGDSATSDSSRTFFQAALDRAPQMPLALWGIGASYQIAYLRGWDVPGLTSAQVYARADSLNRLTISLDSTIAPAWVTLAVNRLYVQDDVEGTRDALQRAIASDSGFADNYRFRGILKQEIDGDLAGALQDFQHAVNLEPTLARLNSLAAGLMAARRYPEAAVVLERSMATRPNAGAWSRLITTYERMGRPADATRVRRLVDSAGNSAVPFEAALAAHDTAAYRRARHAELRHTADSLIARQNQPDVAPAERYTVAELRIDALLCELGDSKQAMDLIENLYRIRPKRLQWIVTNVDLGCLRQDPRYLPIVKAVGLEPYLRN